MTYKTNEGKTYAIVGTVDGTVASASGVVIASFTANKQAYFTAPDGGYVTISDETAIVTPVFKLAPSALVGESGGGASGGKNTHVWTFADDGTYTIEGDMPIWTNGSNMFNNYTKIISWKGNLPALTSGYNMFNGCTNLRSFSGDLSAMTDGSQMFCACRNLTSFEGDLSNLTKGTNMFNTCSSFTSFEIDLPALTNGSGMFYYCMGLTSFEIDLPALTSGSEMFSYCSSLTSFEGDLPALTNGYNMFFYCKLDLASVQNIANTINTVSSGTIYIGMSSTIKDTADLNTALAAIRAKGWTVQEQYN